MWASPSPSGLFRYGLVMYYFPYFCFVLFQFESGDTIFALCFPIEYCNIYFFSKIVIFVLKLGDIIFVIKFSHIIFIIFKL